jgi:DNA replicative helicase MCM subunit Mcm2 (Cdc46/Mcm family)
MVVGVSVPFKMVSRIIWQCTNFNCGRRTELENKPPASKFDPRSEIKCPSCHHDISNPNPEYVNAKVIQIQDVEPKGELERLDVMLYEKNTENVNAGEVVEIKGDIYIQNQSVKNKKLSSILHSTSIKYEHREELTLTKTDVESFYRFAKIPNIVERLVSMTAPNVIGENDKKLGILRSAVGAQENHCRGRINTLFVGPPGTAKSMLAREATKLIRNSRYVTAQNASGKSLTAIIDKENDNSTFLRLGPIPLAKNAICAINEIGSMSFEDQRFLLDIMEEGRFTIDKYGNHQEIDSPTTIIATANPHGIYWKDSYKIGNEEIPVSKAMIDRFDQVHGFVDSKSEEEIKEYAERKIGIAKRKSHNYNFLVKYVLYAKTISPLISDEAIVMLNRFWEKLKINGIASNRTFDTIYRIAESHARLHLKDMIDSKIATEAMESIKVMLLQYGHIIQVTEDPREIAQQEVTNIIKETKAPISFSEAVKLASQRNPQIKFYLGDNGKGNNLTVEGNKRFRDLRERFIEGRDTKIMITSMKPLTLFWSDNHHNDKNLGSFTTDPNDLTDQASTTYAKTSIINDDERSDRSDRSVASLSYPNDIQDSDYHSPAIAQNIYRIGHSDTWACHNCKIKGDKWYMRQHLCRHIRSET